MNGLDQQGSAGSKSALNSLEDHGYILVKEHEVAHGHVDRSIADELLQPIELCEPENSVVTMRISRTRLIDQLG